MDSIAWLFLGLLCKVRSLRPKETRHDVLIPELTFPITGATRVLGRVAILSHVSGFFMYQEKPCSSSSHSRKMSRGGHPTELHWRTSRRKAEASVYYSAVSLCLLNKVWIQSALLFLKMQRQPLLWSVIFCWIEVSEINLNLSTLYLSVGRRGK